jgi:Holliday junction DNA helicase RuvA
MIGRLQGTLVVKQPPFLLVNVNGVGYEVEAPMSTFYELPALGHDVLLHTHLLVREDAQILYGFYREDERTLFRTLLKISGVGGKMALAILSGMSTHDFFRCVQFDDHTALTRIPGVGKKTAQRLVIEIKDKLNVPDQVAMPAGQGLQSSAATPLDEAISALIALGYKPADASRMVKAVAQEALSSEELIRAALQATMSKAGNTGAGRG